jgi:Diguanylate cyclase, GGDEF domain
MTSSRPDSLNVVESDLFGPLIKFELQKAARLQYGVAIVCMTIELPAERPSPAVTKEMADTAIAALRATDVVTVLTEKCLAVLLIDADASAVPHVIQRVIQAWKTIPATMSHGIPGFSWSAGGSLYPQTSSRAADLVEQALATMESAKVEGGNRLRLYPVTGPRG